MPEVDALELKARVDGILNRWPAVGLAVGVVRNGRLEFFSGHGLADIASGTPITQDTVFRVGSITKTFTAIAVLQLWEQGLVDLDAPANDYLRAYRLLPAKANFGPATVRQLLTHTAGIRAGSAWTATCVSASSSPSAWPTPAWSDPNGRRRAWPPDTTWAPVAHERSATMRS